jgi:hypothetical protein
MLYGTLILLIPRPEGLLITADSLSRDADDPAERTTDVHKIVQCTDHAVATINNACRGNIPNGEHQGEQWDAEAIVESISDYPADDPRSRANHLASAFAKRSSTFFEHYPDDPSTPAQDPFTVLHYCEVTPDARTFIYTTTYALDRKDGHYELCQHPLEAVSEDQPPMKIRAKAIGLSGTLVRFTPPTRPYELWATENYQAMIARCPALASEISLPIDVALLMATGLAWPARK